MWAATRAGSRSVGTTTRPHSRWPASAAGGRPWGQDAYPGAERLLICADGGGSNGYRVRLWKVELQQFADATGLTVTVCHLPPGTSKWNKIEHRLFAHISMNWRGRPLVSHEIIVDLIGATTTATGLRVQAELDPGAYPTKVKVSDDELATVQLTPHAFHGEWNYTVTPRPTDHMLSVALDDFGTGYSNLCALDRLPVNELKIDKSVIAAVSESRNSQIIVRAVAGLAQELGLVTVAEGVEQLESCRWLASIGIEQVQGFGIARPMPSNELLSWISGRSRPSLL